VLHVGAEQSAGMSAQGNKQHYELHTSLSVCICQCSNAVSHWSH
jgi:hypothetical protein